MTNRYYTPSHDKYSEPLEDSTSHKLKNAYWTTKQVVIKKLGRKEDEHVVASDSELDAKLELFRSVQRTCLDMTRILDRYQDKICMLSQAENELGRFLKNHGAEDKTRAGKMMIAVGKSLSFSAQQRLALRVPLSRLHQEVETFRFRAIADTLQTVTKMENKRTEYRAALLWMKDVSDNLDPDTFKQLDKFRKVQTQVRTTKSKFDKMKLDSMQKVDLLAASRCNMFSHVLSLYQTTLLQFWEKTCRTMVAVADSFKGYQYYEFSMLKDLTDESKKLAQLTRNKNEEDKNKERNQVSNETTDLLLMQHRYCDADNNSSNCNSRRNVVCDEASIQEADDFDQLNKRLDEIFTGEYKDDPDSDIKAAIESNKQSAAKKQGSLLDKDSISGAQDCISLGLGDTESEDRALLEELLMPTNNGSNLMTSNKTTDSLRGLFDEFMGDNTSTITGDVGASTSGGMGQDWSSLFQQNDVSGDTSQDTSLNSLAGMMPSALLDMRSPLSSSASSNIGPSNATHSKLKTTDQNSAQQWLNMFADLDPLANPDNISKKEGQITDT